jgi:hypothetical protein
MQREEFLNQPDVAGFINWLRTSLPTQVFHLQMASSRFVPGGLNVQVTGLPSVLQHYVWRTDWKDPHNNNQPVLSSDWNSTQASLQRLQYWISNAVATANENEALAACLEILHWGGVRGAIPFVKRLHSENRLVAYFQSLCLLMALDTNPSQCLSQLTANNVERFDAGLTKICALLDSSGSPIYDSRVGAAMAMLYALYRASAQTLVPSVLRFPSGSARGRQIRNPGTIGYQAAPQFFTNQVSSEEWARWQVRLGWILRAVLDTDQCDWFEQEGDIAERCHAFEACLFMVGYDLRCFLSPAHVDTQSTPHTLLLASKPTNWVPAGHNFSTVIRFYIEFRRQAQNDTRIDFCNWLVEEKNYTPAAASSYCFPLGVNEFDLYGRHLDELQCIADGGERGLYAALGSNEPYVAEDDRVQVCLVDAWLAGCVMQLAPDNAQRRRELLINAGFAGTNNAANTLLSVGRNVGRHFGLLGQDAKPTGFYHRFYIDSMNDFEHYLQII